MKYLLARWGHGWTRAISGLLLHSFSSKITCQIEF
jgi:hypothetical protein